MKKKAKENRKRTSQKQNNEARALNRELGNFGLEPPKIYKNSKQSDFSSITDSDIINLPSFSRRSNDERDRESERQPNRRSTSNSRSKRVKADDRKKNKLKRKIIFYTALSVAIVALVFVLSLVVCKVQTITVKGNAVYTQKEIMAILPIEKEENLFFVDKDSASQKVKENLPYVYNVNIKRKIPSTIEVYITETPQVYCIANNDNTYTYLDDTFKVLEENGGAVPEGAIIISNIKLKSAVRGQKADFGKNKNKKNIKKLVKTINKLKLDNVTEIYSKDVNNNYLVYEKRLTVKLGTLDKLERKLYAAYAAIDKLNETDPQAKGTVTATDVKQIYFTAK